MAAINPFSQIGTIPKWEGIPQSFVEWMVRLVLRLNSTATSDQASTQSRARYRACDIPWNNDFEIFPDSEIVADGWEKNFETQGSVGDANYGRSKTPWKGTFAQELKTSGSNGVSVASRPIPVKDGTKYTLTAQAKINDASSAADGFYARVLWYNSDADFTRTGAVSFVDVVAGEANFFSANDTYTPVSLEVTVPVNARFVRIAFYSWTQAGAARTITVDGVSFVQTTIDLDGVDNSSTYGKTTLNQVAGAGLGYDGLYTGDLTTIVAQKTFTKSNPGVVNTSSAIGGSTTSATYADIGSQAFFVPPGTVKMSFPAVVSIGDHVGGEGTVQTSVRFRLTDGASSIYSNVYQTASQNCHAGVASFSITLVIDNIDDTFPNGGNLTVYIQTKRDGTCTFPLPANGTFTYKFVSSSLTPEVFA